MKRRSLILCTVLASLAPLAPLGGASAQDKLDVKTTMRVMHSFGLCAAKRRLRSEKLLDLLPGSAAEQKLVKSLTDSSCLSAEASLLKFKAPVLRGAIAEALFEQDFGTVGAVPRHRPATVFVMPPRSEMAKFGPYTEIQLLMIEFGSCVVKADPIGVQQLLLAKPTTSREAQAWAALSPKFGPCMEGGRSLKLNKLQLRGMLAEGAYRVAVNVAMAPIATETIK